MLAVAGRKLRTLPARVEDAERELELYGLVAIVRAVREGRRIYDNIRRFVRYGLTGGSARVCDAHPRQLSLGLLVWPGGGGIGMGTRPWS